MSAGKCIVTDGTGFIGSHAADLLIDSGYPADISDDLSTGQRRRNSGGERGTMIGQQLRMIPAQHVA